MIREGSHKLVRHAEVWDHMIAGWMIVDPMQDINHGLWSVRMWRCDCFALAKQGEAG